MFDNQGTLQVEWFILGDVQSYSYQCSERNAVLYSFEAIWNIPDTLTEK